MHPFTEGLDWLARVKGCELPWCTHSAPPGVAACLGAVLGIDGHPRGSLTGAKPLLLVSAGQGRPVARGRHGWGVAAWVCRVRFLGCFVSPTQVRETPPINTPETNRKQQSSWRNTCSAAQGESEGRFWGQSSCLGKGL